MPPTLSVHGMWMPIDMKSTLKAGARSSKFICVLDTNNTVMLNKGLYSAASKYQPQRYTNH